jgi:hypothetical protein
MLIQRIVGKDNMNGADIAAGMIREGAMPQAAFHAAAKRTGEKFRDVARECARRSAARRTARASAYVSLWRGIGNGMTRDRAIANDLREGRVPFVTGRSKGQ